jgi:hypothetical protein
VTIAPDYIDGLRRDWHGAPYGTKAEVVQKWADRLGCTAQSLYRFLPTGRQRKRGDRLIQGIEDAAMKIAAIKRRPPKHKGMLATEDAIEIALNCGEIPPEMAGVSRATFNRIMRDLGMDKRRRIQRFQAEFPNQLHHMDASSSSCFYVARRLPDGDRVLKLHAGHARYKNKPVPTRERPWIYGMVDDYSGFHAARYVAALGENLGDNLDFLCWAWSKNADKEFFGLPARVKADHGPLMKGQPSVDFLKRLSISIDGSVPEQKEAHGKIERPWRTMWNRFELPFFAEADWKGFEIALSELNRRFLIYQESYNAQSHRFEKDVSRLDVWRRINLHGGAVALPENALMTTARRYERSVEPDGCFWLDGRRYEVKGLHDAKVFVYRGVFEERLVVEDRRTGEKYEVEDFAPTPLDTFVGHPDTPAEKAAKEAQNLGLSNTLYLDRKDQGNLALFPTRIKETRELANPLDVDVFPSLEVALREVTAICGVRLDKESREAVAQLLLENGLSRRFAADLALEIQVEIERRAQ